MTMRKKNSPNHISSHVDEEALETSLISNSDLLSETTNSEIHKKYLEDQRLAQIELAEFEMIERDLDNIAVSPLLMSTEVKFPPNSRRSAPLPNDIDYEKHERNQDVINTEWSNQSAEYYIGGNYSSQMSRKSQNNRYQFTQTNESEYEQPVEKNDQEYYNEGEVDAESEVEYSVHRQSDDENDEELQEAVSAALIAETQFIRVSHSQHPFQGSQPSTHSQKELYEDEVNNIQGSIDDSVSWGTSPMQAAIRPRLSNDSARMSDTPNKSRVSPAPARYHTSHLSTGAIGDSNNDWDHKKTPQTSRKSPARSAPNSIRQSQSRKSKDSSNSNHETSKSKVIIDEDILIKAKKLEDEIATYQ
jgi:hypothetical protein